ncbi:TetR/AcrR family transcriptional regulator [Cohnella sp. AR92]|uniref:TetR/AcrR family transcriptional regulator n=1 Tax=Cohnella sp. AR92 TaxID=648716 RepID=UPI000F8E0729|nr:TetR/AcrR family transcriptional regulator [Cohnella sp. AR92]RUS45083.1 TetR/AcrR family transcriptional regulator [Cohnella sp. AR92]
MGRRKNFTESELLDATKKLLLDHGYDGFHLKLLSEHVPGARSTIYQYYSNKEEIVAACMKRVMAQMILRSSEVDETDAMEALRHILLIYAEESDFHRLLGDLHKINTANSAAAARDLDYVEQGHVTLKRQLMGLFDRACAEGKLRRDVPLPALIGVFFGLINVPNAMKLPSDEWSKVLFDMWLNGAGQK